jgi:glycosyltransferase involved in cell wall biosynthesis
MKIIFLVSSFHPHVGGLPVRAHRIAKGLSERGHEITIHTRFHPKVPLIERINGIKVERHHELKPLFSQFVKIPIAIIPSLLNLFGKEEILRADVIQSFGWLSFSSLIAASLKFIRGKPFVLSPIFSPYYLWYVWDVKLYRWVFGPSIIRYADFLTPQTDFERDKLIQLGVSPDRTQVLPNAIESDSYKKLPDPIVFRNKYGIGFDEKIILFVGTLTRFKGLNQVVLALLDVLRKIKKVKLVLIGPNVHNASAMLRHVNSSDIRDHTIITGPLKAKSLIYAYSAADIFVFPTIKETFGSVILEAAASGLPIVCTRTGVAPEIITHGENGLFVDYGNVDQISNAIIRVLTDSNFKRKAEKRREFILKKYDHKKEIDQYEKIYSQLASHSSLYKRP